MFLMKNKLVLFITGCFALVLSSCLKSDEIVGVEAIKNCQIHTFSLSHDSVSGLDTVKFTIDQLTGRIFNIDSLPFGTKIEKVVCKIGFANSSVIGGVEASPEAYPDSTYYLSSLSDSIDFSAPVKFVVHAYDQVTTKVYMAQVNIHQVVPDSMVWSMYANPMIGITVKDQKVVTYDYNGVAQVVGGTLADGQHLRDLLYCVHQLCGLRAVGRRLDGIGSSDHLRYSRIRV